MKKTLSLFSLLILLAFKNIAYAKTPIKVTSGEKLTPQDEPEEVFFVIDRLCPNC
jgi:hypothetical protein